ncbi:hypothetical protein [Thiohalocapsa sp. ML1]|uniref:hypothetical protein n=1 Tax=Thiohalocapsa sp. ML1 TaxID=1431688 RepID=UPI000732047F|nr:hypothetical protein [Thiohalocapsa sp. ML1]
MSDLAGQLDITLLARGPTPAARIQSSRPVTAARVFDGKRVATVASQLPLLYSVCGTAQGLACVRACEAALGLAPAPSAQAARDLLLRAETVKEHLWRLLLDWPRALAALGVAAPVPPPGADAAHESAIAGALRAFLTLRATLATHGDPFLPGARSTRPVPALLESAAGTLATIAAEWIFGAPPADWLAATCTEADLTRWAATGSTPAAGLARALQAGGLADLGRCEVGVLPAEQADGNLDPDLLRRLATALAAPDADAFVGAPTLDGWPTETTPFSRELGRGELVAALAAHHGNGLLPRLAALLVELARASAALAAPAREAAAPLGAGFALASGNHHRVGIGAAPAARGLLVHRVDVDTGGAPESACVMGYRILAPTEWNFHPQGVVATALSALARDAGGGDALLAAHAGLVITAVDPCVEYCMSVC